MKLRPATSVVVVAASVLLAACAANEPTRLESRPPQPLPTTPAMAPQAPVVTAPAPAKPAVPPPARRVRTVQDAQQRLAEFGYDPGPADGISGAQTRAALRAFQSARGLRPTGRMDSPTREALEK